MGSSSVNVMSDKSLWRVPGLRAWHIRFGLLVLLVLAVYALPLAHLVATWSSRDEYSHGFIIPLVSMYLVWINRRRLAALTPTPSYGLGLLAVLASALLLVMGRVGSVLVFEQFSFVFMIGALVLLQLGMPYLRATAFPIAYLVFMLPVVDEVVGPIQGPLRQMTAEMSVAMLNLLGFPVLLQGLYIVLPRITLEVAQQCSGANFLVATIAIGIPLALLVLKSRLNQVILLISAVAIALVANWMRVALIGIGAYYEYPVLHGPFHVLNGLLAAQIGFVYLFVAAWALSKTPRERLLRARTEGRETAPLPSASTPAVVPAAAGWTAVGLLGAMLLVLSTYDRGPVPLRAGADLPFAVGEWVEVSRRVDLAPFRLESADREIVRVYRNPTGREVQVYIAYFNAQRQGKELVNDHTRHLHDAAAQWRLPLEPSGAVSVNRGRLSARRGDYRIVFWYDLNGEVIADRYRAMGKSIVRALVNGRTNGALVVVTDAAGGGPDGRGGEAESDDVQDFVKRVIPVVNSYLQSG